MDNEIVKKVARLLEVKSIVTIALTAAMLGVLFAGDKVSSEALALFSASYGSIITYFFTRKDSESK